LVDRVELVDEADVEMNPERPTGGDVETTSGAGVSKEGSVSVGVRTSVFDVWWNEQILRRPVSKTLGVQYKGDALGSTQSLGFVG